MTFSDGNVDIQFNQPIHSLSTGLLSAQLWGGTHAHNNYC